LAINRMDSMYTIREEERKRREERAVDDGDVCGNKTIQPWWREARECVHVRRARYIPASLMVEVERFRRSCGGG
jgi:hypothetical protein